VDQQGGGACHTGERSCFFRAFGSGSGEAAARDATDPVAVNGRAP
jgi:hypothetical protein